MILLSIRFYSCLWFHVSPSLFSYRHIATGESDFYLSVGSLALQTIHKMEKIALGIRR